MNLLPSSSYKPPQVRTQSSNVIHQINQENFARCRSPNSIPIIDKMDMNESDNHFPTPNANTSTMVNSPSPSTSSSSPSSHSGSSRRDSTSSSPTDFEDLYDSSDSEVVPLKISNSIKQILTKANWKREHLPSLVIPSPSAWPTVQKLRKSASSSIPDSSSEEWPLSPAALTRLAASEKRDVLQCTTPSLDGSLTSKQIAGMTSPSTPDTRSHEDTDGDWGPPIQLHPAAMNTLQQLSTGSNHVELDCSITASPVQRKEMQEFGLNIDNIVSPENEAEGPLDVISAISVPSPGGFFASLASQSKRIWSLSPRDITPSTGTAESFYKFPWGRAPAEPVERVVEIRDNNSDGPPTARQETYSRNDVDDAEEIAFNSCVYEYDEEYERKLKDTATANMSRTSLWLFAQDTYLSAIKYCNMTTREELAYKHPHPPHSSTSRSEFTSPSKKSVRFASGDSKTPVTAIHRTRPPTNNPLFYHAFQHLQTRPRRREAFLHRHLRADALQAQRLYLPELHRAQLQGRYALRNPGRPQDRFSHLPNPPNDKTVEQHRDDIARAGKERQALQQVSLSFWNLEAIRLLNHGRLLPKRASVIIRTAARQGRIPRILDLAGQPTGDWGWAVALDYRHAKVYTAMPISPTQVTSKPADWLSHRGPSNHRTLTVDSTWTLPFPSNTFDVISARGLHTLLRTCKPSSSPISPTAAAHFSPKGKSKVAKADEEDNGEDEYDATLTELHRVLAPGGILHFSLLDAEVIDSRNSDSGSELAARSVEFAVALRSRGYDPCATRRFLARLEKADFVDVERAWLALPLGGEGAEKVGGGSSRGMETVAGMVGTLEWEKWMLKLQMEMGKPEERLLEGVAADLEQARRQGEVGWVGLCGSARKAWV